MQRTGYRPILVTQSLPWQEVSAPTARYRTGLTRERPDAKKRPGPRKIRGAEAFFSPMAGAMLGERMAEGPGSWAGAVRV